MNDTHGEPQSFEESLLELERLVRDLEDGRLGLDEALVRYEQGVGLIKFCYQKLRQAEQRIVQLTGTDDSGQPILQPFKHEATGAKGAGSRGPGSGRKDSRSLTLDPRSLTPET